MRLRPNGNPPPLSQQFAGFAMATHPGPTLVVTAATTALAVAAGRGWGSVGVTLAALAGQCSVGWSNDVIDAERDRRVGRLSKPIVAKLVTRRQLAIATIAAFACCIPLSLLSGWRAACIGFVAGISALTYNLGVKATFLSPLPYAISFGLLPAFVTWGLPLASWPQPVVMVATAMVGVGAHFINAVADIDDDIANSVRGLPQRLGSRHALEVGTFFLLFASVLVAFQASSRSFAVFLLCCVVLIDVGVLVAGMRGRTRTAWRLTMLSGIGCLTIFVVGGGALVTAH
jgi:4-hydroxybenzoate polyprenyltransferase